MSASLASAVEGQVARLAASPGAAGPDVERCIREYGRTLLPLPEHWREFADQYQNGNSGALALDVGMWTSEEGRSDLTLQLIARAHGDRWTLEITDIRVL